MFTKEVIDRLDYYVYRLIDPRNGETFYVGKGRGNRVFQHANAKLGADADQLTEKLRRIRDIKKSGLEVGHVIHRHGLTEEIAFEVESALIDAYPAATNLAPGRGSDDRGLMHANQIRDRYAAKEAEFRHKAIVINVNRSADQQDIYDAVRYAWKLNPEKAEESEIVLAVSQGLIIGVFRAEKWLKATIANFPGTPVDQPDRWGFVGSPAEESVAMLYLRRRLPESMRRPGAANPIRYVEPCMGGQ